jgi:hypothetical protein
METRQRWVTGPIMEISGTALPRHLTGSTIIIADPGYWMHNEAELEADLLELGGERQGMVLWFPNQETRTIWLLRWS